MMRTDEFRKRACLESEVLDTWIEASWIIPADLDGRWSFHAVDLARVQLIQDLRDDMGVNDEGVGIILDLVDQIGGLRHTVIHMSAAVRSSLRLRAETNPGL